METKHIDETCSIWFLYLVNESESGYIYKSLLYTGKEMTEKLAGDYKYVATKIVMDLMQDLLDIGHTLFIDNWYSSFELSKLLLSHSTDSWYYSCRL